MAKTDLSRLVQFNPKQLRAAISACMEKAEEYERERQRFLLLAQTYRQLLTLHGEGDGAPPESDVAAAAPSRNDIRGRFLWVLEAVNARPEGVRVSDLAKGLAMDHPKGLGGFVSAIPGLFNREFAAEEIVRKQQDKDGMMRWIRGPRISEAIERLKGR